MTVASPSQASPSYPTPPRSGLRDTELAALQYTFPVTRSSNSSLEDAFDCRLLYGSAPARIGSVADFAPQPAHASIRHSLCPRSSPSSPIFAPSLHHPLAMAQAARYNLRHSSALVAINGADSEATMDDSESPRSQPSASTSTASHSLVLSRPLTTKERSQLTQLDALRLFLLTGPAKWGTVSSSSAALSTPPALHRFPLPGGEPVSCVRWRGLFYITGTDVVRALVFRFAAFGRPVRHMKKFEEGIFSDLRNLKPGQDATLEEPKSPFLDLLFKHQCIRTQKKQKVFLWFSVPHDRLFLDALERDLKRERTGHDSTSEVVGEPAQSFVYDPSRHLIDQFLTTTIEGGDEPALLTRFAGSEGPEGYKQRRPNRSKPQESELPEANFSDSGSASPPPTVPTLTHGSHMGFGYSPHDADLTASDMFVRQASGAFAHQFKEQRVDAMRRKAEEKEKREHDTLLRKQDHASVTAEEQARVIRERLLKERGNVVDSEVVEVAADTDHDTITNPGSSSALGFAFTTAPMQLASPGHSGAAVPSLGASSTSSAFFPHANFGSFNAPNMSATALNFTAPMQHAGGPADATAPGSEKPFPCPHYPCGRAFKRAEHLRRHLRTHTSERPFMCNSCDKRFARSDNLAQHMRVHARAAASAGHPEGADTEVAYASLTDGGVSWPTGLDEGDDSMSEASSGFSGVSRANDDASLPTGTSFWIPPQLEGPGMAAVPMSRPLSSGHNSPMALHLGHLRSVSDGSNIDMTAFAPPSAPSDSVAFNSTTLAPVPHVRSGRPKSWAPHGTTPLDSPGLRRPLTAAIRERNSVHGSSTFSPYALAALSHVRSTQSSPSHGDIHSEATGMVAPDFGPPMDDFSFAASGPYPASHLNMQSTYPPVSSHDAYSQHIPRLMHSASYPSCADRDHHPYMPPTMHDHLAVPGVGQHQLTYGLPAFSAEPEPIMFDNAMATGRGMASAYSHHTSPFVGHDESQTAHDYFGFNV